MSERAARARTALKFAISVGLLLALGSRVDRGELARALGAFPVSGLLLGSVMTLAQLVVGAQRWRRLLRRTGARVSLFGLIEDTLVASAYTMVLPSPVGGDVIRAVRCGRRLEQPAHAWSTALFERLVGFPCLALAATPGILVVPGGRALLVPTLVVAVGGALALVLADAPLRWAARRLAARAPALAEVSEGIAQDLQGPLATRGARAEAIGWTLLYQLAGISILAVCVAPLGNAALVAAIYAGLPLIVIGSMLPVSIGGIGLRESLFVVVLGRLGVGEATALGLGLVWLATYLLVAGPGVVLVLLGGRATKVAGEETIGP